MKPDQHKKKRSEQYKKKHNIKTEDSKKNKGKSAQEASQPKGKDEASKERLPVKVQQKITDADVDQYFTEVQPEFRKRAVQSNWSQYEDLPPEDDEGELRGADFQALLDATSSSVSQFQFADEKDWMVETDDLNENGDGVLAIDVKDLSAAMLTIPLYERLNISKDLFEHDEIEEFDRDAARHMSSYDAVCSVSPQQEPEDSEAKTADTLTSRQADDESGNDATDMLDDILGGGTDLSKGVELKAAGQKSTVKDLDVEDDLDSLLSGTASTLKNDAKQAGVTERLALDITSGEAVDSKEQQHSKTVRETKSCSTNEPEKHTAQEKDVVGKKKPPVKGSNLEDDLEDLLNLDTPVEPKPKVGAIEENNDLDDWLDSVLDD